MAMKPYRIVSEERDRLLYPDSMQLAYHRRAKLSYHMRAQDYQAMITSHTILHHMI